MGDVIEGKGWAVTNLDDLGEGPGFRKIRAALGITAGSLIHTLLAALGLSALLATSPQAFMAVKFAGAA